MTGKHSDSKTKQSDDEKWFSGAIQASRRQRQTLFLFSADCFSKLAFTFQNTYRQVHACTHSGIDENQHPAGTELWLYLHTQTAQGEHFILWMLYKHKYPPPTLSLSLEIIFRGFSVFRHCLMESDSATPRAPNICFSLCNTPSYWPQNTLSLVSFGLWFAINMQGLLL